MFTFPFPFTKPTKEIIQLHFITFRENKCDCRQKRLRHNINTVPLHNQLIFLITHKQ